jgi:hypothetical protein
MERLGNEPARNSKRNAAGAAFQSRNRRISKANERYG